MSHPDKEKSLNKVAENAESLKSLMKKKTKGPLREISKEEQSHFPIGKLKWSKEDEVDQDTDTNLNLKDIQPKESETQEDQVKQDATPQEQEMKKSEVPTEAPSPNGQLKSDLPKSQPTELDDDQDNLHQNPVILNTSSDQENDQEVAEKIQSSKERNLSLEDTLTPIDFKEYSIDPEPEYKKPRSEYYIERKKPSFRVSQELGDEDQGDISEQEKEPVRTGKKVAIWALKILWLPALLTVVLIVGLMIGHSTIGNEPAGDVFDLEVWEHLYNLIYKK